MLHPIKLQCVGFRILVRLHCVNVRAYVCVCVCVYIYIYIYTYTHTYIHLYDPMCTQVAPGACAV